MTDLRRSGSNDLGGPLAKDRAAAEASRGGSANHARSTTQPLLHQSWRDDLAECVALKLSFGDELSKPEAALLREYGYLDRTGRLTAAGWEASAEAIGFQDD